MKKGFTLAELLGVIAILGIIVILVFQEFSKQMKNAKQQAYERQVTTIISAAKDYHLANSTMDGVMLAILGDTGAIKVSDLKDPRDSQVMTGCVLFEKDSYGQTEYVYHSSINECAGTNMSKAYIKKDLFLYYDAKNRNGTGVNNSTNTWKDLSGNDNDGILNNFGSTQTSGWQDDSLAFDGSNDWVNTGKHNYPNVTVEAVVSLNAVTSTEKIIVGNYDSGGYGIVLQNSKLKGSAYISTYQYATYQITPTINTIYHIVNTYDGEDVKLYINGILVSTTNAEGTIKAPNGNNVLALGANPTGSSAGGGFLNGKLYLVRGYSRALTEAEVQANYLSATYNQ